MGINIGASKIANGVADFLRAFEVLVFLNNGLTIKLPFLINTLVICFS
jgi:hypothetical protein